jgi:hypothetical protein
MTEAASSTRDPHNPLIPLLVDLLHSDVNVVEFLNQTEQQLHIVLMGLLNGQLAAARVACDALWAAFAAARKMAESSASEAGPKPSTN